MSSSSGTSVGIVSDLWRYPVKSFPGQRDRRAFLGLFGFLGDCRCAVLDMSDWQPLTARRVPVLLGYGAAIAREREHMFGVYCRVVRGGWVQVGDRVTIGRVPVHASA